MLLSFEPFRAASSGSPTFRAWPAAGRPCFAASPRLLGLAGLAAVLAVFLPSAAHSALTLESGRSATFKNRPGATDDKGRVDLRYEAGTVPVLDPTCGSGNAVVVTLGSDEEDYREIELPCEHWVQKSSGYAYRDRAGAASGVIQVAYMPGRFSFRLGGASYDGIEAPAEAIEAGMRVGGGDWCARFTQMKRNDGEAVSAGGPTTACGIESSKYALLGSNRGGSHQWDFCYGKDDATPLPVDPRTLVQPGVSDGKAVHFNAWWKDCHVDPVAVEEVGAATTCGELRGRFYRGGEIFDTGGPGVGGLFTATDPTEGPTSMFTADQLNEIWRVWGLLERPDNFDELVAERYGSSFSESPNPYPKPGEDPQRTSGGSGRLPEMFTQMRNADGTWSGQMTVTCHACHTGNAGSPGTRGPGVTYGGGSSLADLNLFLRDFLALGYQASIATTLNLNRTRGRNNASLINLAFAAAGVHAPDILLGVITSGSTADMDTPAWWNMGHRPVKFVDGVFPMDAPRVDAVFYAPSLGTTSESQQWMRENGPDMNTWIETLKSPEYPYPIDTELAEEGSVLFHELDLWAPERSNPVRRPEGNGSCASCHGAYAPRYVNDPDFLADPALAGIASYIVPLDIIATDPERVLTNNEEVQVAGSDSFFGYPPTKGTDQDCGPQNQSRLRGDREIGYLAPPLHGIWASAPYLHNGAVPNLWEILEPADRKPIWRRASRPPRADQAGNFAIIMGYDTDLDRAFDQHTVGWRYEEVPCVPENILNPMTSPYVSCNPDDAHEDPLSAMILDGLYSNLLLAWNIFFPPILTPQQMEDRKNFNTRMYGQDNAGHEFNAVLTDHERLAIIEYVKTL
jgi:mono/diheme cytochrome c family protein